MRFTAAICVVLLLWAHNKVMTSTDLNIVFWVDPIQKDIISDIAATVKELGSLPFDAQITDSVVVVDNEKGNEEKNFKLFCDVLNYTGVSIILDFTYYRWEQGMDYIESKQIPYIRVGRMMKPFLDMFKLFAQQKDIVELVILVQNQQDKRQVMLEVVMGLPFRTLVLNAGDDDPNKDEIAKQLLSLRPVPAYYAIFAKGTNMNAIFERVSKGGAFLRPAEWHFVFLDTRDRLFKYKKQAENANKFIVNSKAICKSLQMKDIYCQSEFTFQRALLLDIFRTLIDIRQRNVKWLESIQTACHNDTENTVPAERQDFNVFDHIRLSDFLSLNIGNNPNNFEEYFNAVTPLTYRINVSINLYSNEHEADTDLASYQNEMLKKINQTLSPAKRFFRIGTVEAIPWSYYRRHPHTDEILLDSNGQPIWEGFCIDMIQTLSNKMNFDYEIVTPTQGKFGRRDPKTKKWDGLIGDLVSGETDFVVAALKMYSEREEYVDYIAPYFEQTGISIVMRKPARQTSLFKFMTVLRVEVWMSIVAALVSTAVMIWLLDKYSPYSARNNKEAYPYPCREFSLRECFWFALTSFTPQGGGEVPKSISARILVAAYWLFVVLMLATFTANLAAFLTVERMQTPVQSLEQLARQSRINYTVVQESDSHHYFINMDFAEKTLYRMWKQLALNASRDFHKFRVWDYPIREQYGRILLAINSSMPVQNAAEGFRKVNEREKADFAFIHDSSEIKYEITRNCNLTEVGEVFAEQPYAMAVQQGSHLADPLAYALLELQKDRYFEDLKAKYWNRSRSHCPLSEEEEGITLDSLGGVFIATLCGLGFALVSLVFEVFCHRKKLSKIKNESNIRQVKPLESSDKRESAWYIGMEKKTTSNFTPPPSFDTATFRGRKIPSGITLGSEFNPRRQKMPKARRQLHESRNEDLPSADNVPDYME